MEKLRRSGGRRSFRKFVFIQLLLSFVCTLLIPVAIGGLLYNKMERAMIGNATQSNRELLEQARMSIDSRMKEVDQLSVQVALHPSLQLLLYGEEGRASFDHYNYVELINGFKRYRNVSPIIDDYYVYVRESGHILTTSIKTNASMFYNHIHKYRNRSESDMVSLLSRYHLNTYLPAEPVQYSLKQKNMITFVRSLPMGDAADVRGALVVMIDETDILGLLRKADEREANFYILNEQMQVLSSTAPEPDFLKELAAKLTEPSGDFETEVDGQQMMVSYTRSSPNQWTYISVLPKDVVLSKVNETKSLALALVLVCLAAGIAASYYFAYRNHRPFRELIHAIVKGKNLSDIRIKNEFAFIKSELLTSLDEERNMRGLLSQQAPVIKSDFIARMIKGHVDMRTLTNRDFDFMDVHFRHDYFGVILIQIDDCHQFIQEDSEREWTLIRFIIINLSNELLEDRGYAIEMERDRVGILLNHHTTAREFGQEMERFLEQLKGHVELKFRTSITVAISGLEHEMDAIAEAYGEAIMALEYRLLQGESSVIYYHDIKDAEHHYYYYPLETEAQLINYAKSGDFASLSKVLDHVFEVNLRTRAISPEMGKCLLLELLNTVLKLFNTLNMDERVYFDGDGDPVKYMLRLGTAERINEKLKQMYAAICAKVEAERTGHSERLYRKILQYVRDHYANNDISLTSVADYCGLNSSYLSSFFKKQSGKNLTEYITELRMQQAKLYLEEGEWTVAQIAQKVGFANDIGLIRVFKKAEGITPGKYREIAQAASLSGAKQSGMRGAYPKNG